MFNIFKDMIYNTYKGVNFIREMQDCMINWKGKRRKTVFFRLNLSEENTFGMFGERGDNIPRSQYLYSRELVANKQSSGYIYS